MFGLDYTIDVYVQIGMKRFLVVARQSEIIRSSASTAVLQSGKDHLLNLWEIAKFVPLQLGKFWTDQHQVLYDW